MNFKFLRGFVLPEALIVIFTIVILSALVLTGVKAFQAGDRDAKRIEDLNRIQSDLSLYFTRWGHYPGDKNGAMDAPADWAAFADAFTSLGIDIPNDPVSGATYYYAYDSDKLLTYALGAKLERYNKVLENAEEIDGVRFPRGTGSAPWGMDCDDNDLGYCIGSY